MIQDKFYPATWKKYGEAWHGAVGYWTRMMQNWVKMGIALFALAYFLLTIGISWFTIAVSFVVLYFVGKWASLAAYEWFMYSHVDHDTSIIVRPKWKKMGGTEESWIKTKAGE